MINKVKIVTLLLMFFVNCLSAGIKDTLFTQEYHVSYPLENKEQNNVQTIIVDKLNNVWVGTNEGVFVLNQNTKNWEAKLGEENQGPINDLFIDSKGEIWIATWNGLYNGNINKLKKIENINSPISVVSEINNNIIAISTNEICRKIGEKWYKTKTPYSRKVRKLIPDQNDGFYLATGKGLYHHTPTETKLFQNENDLYSDDVYGIDFTDEGELWIGALGGITVYNNDKRIKNYFTKDGIPNAWVRCVEKAPNGSMWIGTDYGITRFDGKTWSVRNSRRWLINDNVRDITFDGDGTAWIATANGVSAIKIRKMNLAQKDIYYKNIMKKRHIREPYFVEKCRFKTPGDTTNWEPQDDDNDGQYTSMYLVMESFRYAVTKDEEAKANAKKAFEALKFLQTVTGTDGFFARTVIPPSWKRMANANRKISDREWAKRVISKPRENRIEDYWVLSKDGKWLWKRGTSSDEFTGHMFGYLFYYDLVADDQEKEIVKNHIVKIMNYLINGGYVFIDIDGKKTVWAVWAPEYLNENPDWVSEKGINSLEILSFLKLAYHVSGDEYFQKEYYKLWNDHNYKDNVINAKVTLPSWRTYIDDELLALAYPALLLYETDVDILNYYKKSFNIWYDALKNDDNPLFYFIYIAYAKNNLNVDRSIFLLQDNPLDLIRWKIDNSKREDLELTRYPIAEDIQINRLVPPSERGIMRWDNNPWKAVQGDGGMTESDGVYWRLAYWAGRYYNIIE